jgi:sulfite reductase beta subunit-like hemoprotein
MAKVPKEELLKQEKDGLDVFADIPRFAKEGFESIPKGDLGRLKWYGVYTQRPEKDGYFMLRIRIPAGQMTSAQLREIGRITKQYARNVGDITTRQDIQLHWIRIENIPGIFDTLHNKLGLGQSLACGDGPRNVTSCPLAGVTTREFFDARPYAAGLAKMYADGGKEFSNLPRKFKTAIGACHIHCHAPQINCVGLYGVERKRRGGVERGFGLLVGGGLRDTPHYGQSLRVFLPQDLKLVKDVCRSIAHVFRDCDELRQGRLRARLKFYVARVGWEAFRDQLEEYLGYKLEHDDSIVDPVGASHDDHIGIGTQQDGLRYVGVPIERGRFSGDEMMTLADLSDKYAQGEARLVNTIKQNLVMENIAPGRVEDLVKALTDHGLSPQQHPLRTSLLSCTGIEFCKLAVVETKQRAKEVLNYLEERVELDEPLFISVTGCPNSCAQYQIADIGLHGVPTKYQGERVDGYHVLLGGRLGAAPRFADFIVGPDGKRFKVPSPIIHEAIERVLNLYKAERNGERFSDWAVKQDQAKIARALYPEGYAEAQAAAAAKQE